MPDDRLTIKSWAEEDRPREKMLLKGRAALSDSELLAILIGSGIVGETAMDLAQRLLATANNDLNQLGKMEITDFRKHKGIGEARAVTIAAALELGRRRKESIPKNREQITCSADVSDIFRPMLADLPHEEFWILLLNRSNRVTDKVKISGGGVSSTVTDIRIIVKAAIEKLASSVVAIHNHPSGNTQPGPEDKRLTEKLKNALAFFDIALPDHVIVSDIGYYSFADEGLL